MPAATPSPSVVGPLLFVCALLLGLAAVPSFAWLLRHALPRASRARIDVEPVHFGVSERARRSPRHAVLLHRALLTTAFLVPIALVLVPSIVALRALGPRGLQSAIALVLPVLLVTLHARRRSPGS